MNRARSPIEHRTAAALAIAGVICSLLLAVTPVVPQVRAVDPTPSASSDPSPTPGAAPSPTPVDPSPTPAPTPDPTASPTPDPTAPASADPTPTTPPDALPTPSDSVTPTASSPPGDPAPSPSPSLEPTPLPTPGATHEPRPVIKPGEVWIALQTETDGLYGIHLVRPDGTGLHIVAPRITGDRQVHPDWSPDGNRLAFSVEDGDGTWDLWTVSVDGTDAERIVDCSAPCRSADHPAWSPDGRAVAFERVISSGSMSRSTLEVHDLVSGKEEVVLETLDGRGLQGPRWSPDGTRLAFEELRREDGDMDGEMSGSRIAIVELSSAEPITSPVTDWALGAGDPDWSPAEDLIAFTAPATPGSDRAELWTIRTDGTERRAITDLGTGGGGANDPAFTPNGRALIFAMTRAGQAGAVMATVGLDGTSLGPATESGYLDGEHPRRRPVPGEVPTPIPSPSPPPEPTPTPTPVPSPVTLEATVALSADAPADGRRRVDPGALVTITLTATALTEAPEAYAFVYVPDGWVVVEPSADEAALVAGAIRWSLGDLLAGDAIGRRTVVRAPSGPATGDPAIDGVFRASLGAANGAVQAADLQLLVAPALIVEHVTFSRVHPATHVPTYLVPDEPLTEVEAFDTFRIRFQVRNADLVPASIVPRLQYRIVGGQVFEDLPVGDPILGQPLYLAPEWRAAGNGRNGTVERSDSEAIPEGDLRSDDVDDPTQEPAAGTRFMGVEPTGSIEIDGNTYTEVELSVRATIDLPFARTVEFRLTDDGRPLMGSVSAWMATDGRPPVSLSPGQRRGLDVGPPIDATPTPGAAALSGMLDYELVTGRSAMPARAAISNAVPLYRLAVARRTATGQIGAMAAPGSSLHAPDTSLVSDACARCHSTHAAQGPALLPQANPQSSVCLSCHDGTGSDIDVAAPYNDPAIPANDPATRSYYRHDALAPSVHILAGENEFGGLLERHSECGDCHNPHNSTATDSIQTTTGWSVSGRQAALSGVAVTNDVAGTAPAYTYLDGSAGSQPTREYEICLKCHSGFTTLPDDAGQPPSRQALDKGIELNPANISFHPIEAAGKNQTAAMAASLAGTSPFKQWDFTTESTIRCVNCHGDPAKYDPITPPGAGSALAPHASENRGILLQPYRDRILKSTGEAYDAADFALCLICHGEEPFTNDTSTATNFDLHSLHLTELAGKGSGGTNIDTLGAGQGNAICAECHFRVHSTALRVGSQGVYPRLINFAPNVVTDDGGYPAWAPLGASGGSCTLNCHGKSHDDYGY